MSRIVITYNMEDVLKYGEVYKIQHPKSRIHPLSLKGLHNKKHAVHVFAPSLNRWAQMSTMSQASCKKKWKHFAIWLAEEKQVANRQIAKAQVSFVYHQKTNRKFDLDNMTPKFLLDGFTAAGVFVDDNITVIRPLILDGDIGEAEEDFVEIIIDIKEME